MRLRLGLLQDQAAIDRQIARDAAEHAKMKDVPTVKTEAQMKAEEAGGKTPKSTASLPKPRIRPLSEAKAIDSGANFISEAFLFSIGLGLIVFESWRSRRKENTRRADVAERLEELEAKDQASWQKVDELESKVLELEGQLAAKQGSYGSRFWGSKSNEKTKEVLTHDSEKTTEEDSHKERKATVSDTKLAEAPVTPTFK
jgi:hypothetical protein